MSIDLNYKRLMDIEKQTEERQIKEIWELT